MVYVRLVFTILVYYNYSIIIAKCLAILDEEICCAPRFVDSYRSCPDFDNEKFKPKVEMGFHKDDEALGLFMTGDFEQNVVMDVMYNVELKVMRITDTGKEYMYSGDGNICASLVMPDQPWEPLTKAMNITDCPIPTGIRHVKDVLLNMDFIKPIVKHEWCGEYEIEFKILDATQPISCHLLSVEIYEINQNN